MATIFFDLDGTLIDSQVGVFRCAVHALERPGHPLPGEGAMFGGIGPPMREGSATVPDSREDVGGALRPYRARCGRERWRDMRSILAPAMRWRR